MKRLALLFILALAVSWMLGACSSDKPKPPLEASTWDSAVWNQSKWEK
jgi:outer membrane biogenesis lipoprotein LolB